MMPTSHDSDESDGALGVSQKKNVGVNDLFTLRG